MPARTAQRRIEAARRRLTDATANVFHAEIANERHGGVAPATLSSAIDSVAQGMLQNDNPDTQVEVLTTLLVMRDLIPGKTELRDLFQTP